MRKLPKTRSKVPSQTSGPWITEPNGNDVVVGKINEISSEITRACAIVGILVRVLLFH